MPASRREAHTIMHARRKRKETDICMETGPTPCPARERATKRQIQWPPNNQGKQLGKEPTQASAPPWLKPATMMRRESKPSSCTTRHNATTTKQGTEIASGMACGWMRSSSHRRQGGRDNQQDKLKKTAQRSLQGSRQASSCCTMPWTMSTACRTCSCVLALAWLLTGMSFTSNHARNVTPPASMRHACCPMRAAAPLTPLHNQ